MGSRGFVIKPLPDVDEYVVWSGIVESPLHVGDRHSTLSWLRFNTDDTTENIRKRMERADATGTSDRMGWYPWSETDPPTVIFEQRGSVKCTDLGALTRAILRRDADAVNGLIEPFEDEDLPFCPWSPA